MPSFLVSETEKIDKWLWVSFSPDVTAMIDHIKRLTMTEAKVSAELTVVVMVLVSNRGITMARRVELQGIANTIKGGIMIDQPVWAPTFSVT
ncbi:hypothetical protein [Cronobacter dublinensis]|uniref:hypothetical protein n=1 Tax=Cronobacter dublinensis TaxID=413497 RepID=UPI001319FFE1|nr:hypothetical protein [Cronobacter dublinensis]